MSLDVLIIHQSIVSSYCALVTYPRVQWAQVSTLPGCRRNKLGWKCDEMEKPLRVGATSKKEARSLSEL